MAKYNMNPIQVRCTLRSYEELGSISIFTPIGHRKQELLIMFENKIFIRKHSSIY